MDLKSKLYLEMLGLSIDQYMYSYSWINIRIRFQISWYVSYSLHGVFVTALLRSHPLIYVASHTEHIGQVSSLSKHVENLTFIWPLTLKSGIHVEKNHPLKYTALHTEWPLFDLWPWTVTLTLIIHPATYKPSKTEHACQVSSLYLNIENLTFFWPLTLNSDLELDNSPCNL